MDREEDFGAYAGARWASLVRAGVFLGCSVPEAQDLAQTTLLRCYTSWRKVVAAADPNAYVYRILLNCHRDSRRRRWWNEHPSDALPEPRVGVDPTTELDVADAVHRALRELSTVNREVVVLRFYAHLSVEQTAQVLGIAPGTVKSRLSRALAQLAVNAHLLDLAEGTS